MTAPDIEKFRSRAMRMKLDYGWLMAMLPNGFELCVDHVIELCDYVGVVKKEAFEDGFIEGGNGVPG